MINLETFKQDKIPTTLDLNIQEQLHSMPVSGINIFTEEEARDFTNLVENLVTFKPGVDRYNRKADNRDADVAFIPVDNPIFSHIYKKVSEKCLNVNRNFLKFDVTHIGRLQYSRYKEGQYLNSHCDDYFKYHNATVNQNLVQRKLSVSILLSNPDEYEGGELEIYPAYYGRDDILQFKPVIGTAYLFPSFMQHKVNKITKGIRRSLVVWFFGPAWK